MVQAQLNGFFIPTSRAQRRLSTSRPAAAGICVTDSPPHRDPRCTPASERRATEAEFFADHGFVLLPHATAVRDWDATLRPSTCRGDREASSASGCFPGRRSKFSRSRRSCSAEAAATDHAFYAGGVHFRRAADRGAMTQRTSGHSRRRAAEQWWRGRYERDDVEGFMTSISGADQHGRASAPYAARLMRAEQSRERRHLPEQRCGIAPEGGQPSPDRSASAKQRWYYYPAHDGTTR